MSPDAQAMNNVARKPDIEIRRRIGPGAYRSYAHIYWRPFIVWAFGKVLVGRKHFGR